MTAGQSAIRPRSRVAIPLTALPEDSQTQRDVRGDEGANDERGSKSTSQSPRVLARLPEIAAAPVGKPISLELSWVLNFRWQDRLRRLVQMEPNYLAGGVLALVVFVLVMITMRNRDGASAAVAGNAMAVTSAPAQATPVAEPTVATMQQTLELAAVETPQVVAQREAAGPVAESYETRTIAPETVHDPLAGIYYPRTPFDTPAGVSFEQVAGKPVAAFAAVGPAGQSGVAMRDRTEQREPQPTQSEPVARLDGIITRSR